MRNSAACAGIILTLLFIISSTARPLMIFSDNFDANTSGITGWIKGSANYVTRYTGIYKVGAASMMISGSYDAVTYINTLIFKNIVLSFKIAAVSLLANNTLEAYYDIGGGWIKAASLSTAEANGVFKSYSVSIPGVSQSFRIRFVLNTTSTSCCGFIDDVALTGDRQ